MIGFRGLINFLFSFFKIGMFINIDFFYLIFCLIQNKKNMKNLYDFFKFCLNKGAKVWQ